MRVLVACEFSGVVRDAFAAKGHEATSCDLLPTDRPGKHYQGDIEDILWGQKILGPYWDLIIAHPPCTYLCNSGVRWLHTQEGRWEKMKEAARFFKLFLKHRCKRICIENPIMHKYALESIGGEKYSQIIQPWMFGHPEKKSTCLWLKGLPPLKETNNVKEAMEALPTSEQQKIWYAPPSKDRWKLRSTTFSGIAEAMAEQWGRMD